MYRVGVSVSSLQIVLGEDELFLTLPLLCLNFTHPLPRPHLHFILSLALFVVHCSLFVVLGSCVHSSFSFLVLLFIYMQYACPVLQPVTAGWISHDGLVVAASSHSDFVVPTPFFGHSPHTLSRYSIWVSR